MCECKMLAVMRSVSVLFGFQGAPLWIVFTEQSADMPRMVRHTENLLKYGGNAFGRPRVTLEAICLCSTSEQRRQHGKLFISQFRSPTRCRVTAQCLDPAAIAHALDPLTDCPLRDA